ncbi:hypothetical protein [Thorsellia anophelis]|uniref:Intracellular growth attenuator protein IgaA n=1 Tax=Thorsellia anophelis DSM 18579 TaxID=1123402 RepID=A0A1I0G0J0_9GAMM|nr:hypothetical protein [Thorsellia anophelis]SET63475.1 hypothetical protein SAMN02583745_02935 [Thorsellia anophelis DSM 18579]
MRDLYSILILGMMGILLYTAIVMSFPSASRKSSKKQFLKSAPIRKVTSAELRDLAQNHFFAKHTFKRKLSKARLKSDDVFSLKGEYTVIRQTHNKQVTYIHTINNVEVILPLDAEECIHNHKPALTLYNKDELIESGELETFIDKNGQTQMRLVMNLNAEVVVNSKNEIVVISLKNKFDLVSAVERAKQFQVNHANFLKGRKGSYYNERGKTLVYELLNQRDETPTEIQVRNVITGCAAGFLYLLAAILWLIALYLSFENKVAIILLFSSGVAALIFGMIVHYRYRIVPSPLKINRLRGAFKYALEVDANKNHNYSKFIGDLSFSLHKVLDKEFDRRYHIGDTIDIELYAETRKAITLSNLLTVDQLFKKFPPITLLRHVSLSIFGIVIGLMAFFAPMRLYEISTTIREFSTNPPLNLSADVSIEQLTNQLNKLITFRGTAYCKGISVKPLESHRCINVKILFDHDPRESFLDKQANSLAEVQETIERAFSGGIQLKSTNLFENGLQIKESPIIDGIFTNPENYRSMLKHIYENFSSIYETQVTFKGQLKQIIHNPDDQTNPLTLSVNFDYQTIEIGQLLAAVSYLLMLLLTTYLLLFHGILCLVRYSNYTKHQADLKLFLDKL